MTYHEDLEMFIETNEDALLTIWDEYKYEKYADRFHYDDVDWFDEEFFEEMCYELHSANK